jgi:hypothetical protein
MASKTDRAARYRREAERVRAEADRTTDPEMRAVLLDIAREYETLAIAAARPIILLAAR